MAYKLQINERVNVNAETIYDWLSLNWGTRSADKFFENLFKKIN